MLLVMTTGRPPARAMPVVRSAGMMVPTGWNHSGAFLSYHAARVRSAASNSPTSIETGDFASAPQMRNVESKHLPLLRPTNTLSTTSVAPADFPAHHLGA
jgi:hypothetical protein